MSTLTLTARPASTAARSALGSFTLPPAQRRLARVVARECVGLLGVFVALALAVFA